MRRRWRGVGSELTEERQDEWVVLGETDWVTVALVGGTVDSMNTRLSILPKVGHYGSTLGRLSFQQVKILVQIWVPRQRGVRRPLLIRGRDICVRHGLNRQ